MENFRSYSSIFILLYSIRIETCAQMRLDFRWSALIQSWGRSGVWSVADDEIWFLHPGLMRATSARPAAISHHVSLWFQRLIARWLSDVYVLITRLVGEFLVLPDIHHSNHNPCRIRFHKLWSRWAELLQVQPMYWVAFCSAYCSDSVFVNTERLISFLRLWSDYDRMSIIWFECEDLFKCGCVCRESTSWGWPPVSVL